MIVTEEGKKKHGKYRHGAAHDGTRERKKREAGVLRDHTPASRFLIPGWLACLFLPTS